jgi:hypothetical protein
MMLVHLLVIALLPSWWWTWSVEGLLVLHLLNLIVVVLTSLIRKLFSIRWWQSSHQGLNSINDSSKHATHLRVVSVDCWFFVNSLVIAFIMVQSSLLLTQSSSSPPTGGSGGCPYFGGMVNRK